MALFPTNVNDNIIIRTDFNGFMDNLGDEDKRKSLFKCYLTVLAYIDSYHDWRYKDPIVADLVKSSGDEDYDVCPLRTLFNDKMNVANGVPNDATIQKFIDLFKTCSSSKSPEDNTVKAFENDNDLSFILPSITELYTLDDFDDTGTFLPPGLVLPDNFSIDFDENIPDVRDIIRDAATATGSRWLNPAHLLQYPQRESKPVADVLQKPTRQAAHCTALSHLLHLGLDCMLVLVLALALVFVLV